MKRFLEILAGFLTAVALAVTAVAQTTEPVSVLSLIRESETAAVSNDLSRAVAVAQEATALDPAFAPAWRQLGLSLLKSGKAGEAVPALQRAVELAANDAESWRGLSQALWKTGQSNEAVNALSAGLRLKAEDAGAWRDLAAWLTALGRAEEALSALQRVTELKPGDAAAWREIGVIKLRQGRQADAASAFEKALEHNPDDPAVCRDLGWCLWTLGRREAALENLARAIELNVPERERVALQVTARLAEEGAVTQALDFYRRTAPGAPLLDAAMELVNRGRLQAAEPLLAEAWKAGEKPELSGLHLAYIRAVNGRCAGTGEYLGPFLKQPPKQMPAEQVDLALETLRLCSAQSDLPELMTRLEKALDRRRRPDERITAILEKAAEEQRVRAEPARALALYRRVLERDPDRPTWIWAFLLSEQREGPENALEQLDAMAARAASLAVRAGIAGVQASRRGEAERAAEDLRVSLDSRPDQPMLRQILFNDLLKLGRVEEAREEANWFARRVNEGESTLRSYLAEMLTRLGEPEQALLHWQLLRMGRPDLPYYGIETAFALFSLCRADEALAVLRETSVTAPHPQVFELIAEIESALGHPAEAADWAARGLVAAPSAGLLRYAAENTELLATNYPAALDTALRYLESDPGYVPMNLLAGRAYEALGRTNELVALHTNLLARNPAFLPSLVALRDHAARDGRFGEALGYARDRVAVQPENAEARRTLANSLAQDDRFRPALGILRRLARRPVNDALPILVYQTVSDCDLPGRNNVSQITAHLERLASNGYVFVQSAADLERHAGERRVMIILVDAGEKTVRALDPVLERLNARVVLAGRPVVPTPGLKALLDSGRWVPASSGPGEQLPAPVATDRKGNPLTHRLFLRGRLESPGTFSNRLDRALSEAARTLDGAGERWLVYPGGDYGQRSLDTPPENLEALRNAVARHFTHAVYFDDVGFALPDTPPLRLPARPVPPSWDADALMDYLQRGNPLVRARLELAKVLYWHRQYEAASRWFARAEKVGADAQEIQFNRGGNADQQGDVPTAISSLQKAVELNPGDSRARAALARARNARRPAAKLFLQGWEDNEDRRYLQYGALGDLFFGNRLRLGLSADRNRWEKDGLGREEGTRLGLRGQVFLVPQVWFEGRLWHLDMDALANHWGGEASLHLPNPALSGFLDLFAGREEIETVEALRADIYADLYGARTYTRLLDVFDLFADLVRTERDDHNATTMLDGRLVYRLKEWPYAGVGWRFRFADSDFDPPEYWAPEKLEQHQLYANLRGTWKRLRGSVSAEAGSAREEDTDWRFVWGARADADLYLTPRLSLNGEVAWFEGPVYERLTWRAGIAGRF